MLSEEEQRELGVTSRSVLGGPMFDRIGGMENIRVLEEEAMALAAKGVLVPPVHHFPLAHAARAHRALETRATLGKVVLVP
ncbi:zinc-binding dehydrogenase [Streptomyces sp. SS8]